MHCCRLRVWLIEVSPSYIMTLIHLRFCGPLIVNSGLLPMSRSCSMHNKASQNNNLRVHFKFPALDMAVTEGRTGHILLKLLNVQGIISENNLQQ